MSELKLRDVRHLHREESEEPEEPARPTHVDDAGRWPDDLEVSTYADAAVTLPGKADPGPGCGEWAPRQFCDTCGDHHMAPHRCHKRGCPDCWSSWAARRAESITRKIQAARWALPDGLERRAVHGLVSPPPGEVRTLADVARWRKKALEQARAAGIRGGVTVFHGFRETEEALAEFREEDPDCGLWEWIREEDRHWRDLTRWSPHYHIIGLAEEVEIDDVGEEWVVRRLSTLTSFKGLRQRDSYESIAQTAQYLLSHLSFNPEEATKAVTWFGDLHGSNHTPDPERAAERKTEPSLAPPSEGAWRVIKRLSAEVTHLAEPEEDGEGEAEPDDCPDDDCTGQLQSIYLARQALQNERFCKTIGSDREKILLAAADWAYGDRLPPPGLKNPTTEEQAEEALQALL